jgi:hypothetical protein
MLMRLMGLLVCAALLMSAAEVAQAQSGRRIPKRPTSPDPLPPKSEEPPIEPSKPKDEKPRIPVVVAKDTRFSTGSTYWYDVAVQACLKRLSESASVEPRASREMNRKQASDLAKGSTDTYVVLLEFEVDPSYSSRTQDTMGQIDPRYIYINFTVFTPGTGKVKKSGNVYPVNRGIGGLPIPGRVPNSTAGAEYMMQQAGRETADRVLDAIGAALPAERRY